MLRLLLFVLLLFYVNFASAQQLTNDQQAVLQNLNTLLEYYQLDSCTNQLIFQLEHSKLDSNALFFSHLLLLKARLQREQGDFKAAAQTAQQTIQLARKNQFTTVLASALGFSGYTVVPLGQIEAAQDRLQEAMQLHEQQGDTTSLAYAQNAFYYGKLEQEKENYAKADSLFLIANSIAPTKDTFLYQLILNELAISKLEQEDFAAVATYLAQAEQVVQHRYPENHPAVGLLNHHYSRYYVDLGKIEQAERTNSISLRIWKQSLSNQHPLFGHALLRQVSIDIRNADYSSAEELSLTVKDIFSKTYGLNFDYADVLFYLGLCYKNLGRIEQSNKNWEQAKSIYASTGKLTDYANTLNSLAVNHEELGEYERAESLYLEGLEVLKATRNITFYMVLTANLAELYNKQKKYKEAEPLFHESRNYIVELYNKSHPYYATITNNLAVLYEYLGAYEKAKTMYLEVKALDKATFGPQHPYYIATLYRLAVNSNLLHAEDEAFHYFTQANAGQLKLIRSYYSTSDEATRYSYLEEIKSEFDRFFSFALDSDWNQQTIYTEAQNLNLATKSLALDFSIDDRLTATSIQDTTLLQLHEEYLALRKELGNAYVLSAEERIQAGIDMANLEQQVELLEKRLARSSNNFASSLLNTTTLNWANIKTQLQPDEAAIDFLQFQYRLPERKTDSIYYAALVTRKDSDYPEFIYLAEEKQLARILRANVRQGGNNYVENPIIGHDLYQLVWQPLEPYLKNVKKIKLAPAGLLHRISFAALPTNSTGERLLHDAYRFDYFGNLRDLIRQSEPNPPENTIALMGGAHFTVDSSALAVIAEEFQRYKTVEREDDFLAFAKTGNDTRAIALDSTRSAVEFSYLPGTKTEIEQIEQQFLQKNWQVKTFLGNEALENQFKQLDGLQAPSILHLATHGYFFAPFQGEVIDTDLRSRIITAKSPLLRSGLALTGANYYWKGGTRISGLDDGILTAYEISNLNLFQTKLVVLSACETGLGDIYDTEGVFGLQRAFKTAGVEQLITSLWKVPDAQTTALMNYFYQYYLDSYDAAAALYQAQQELRKQYRSYHWAAFILIN